ncbi:tetratricopeptide repeat protein [Lacisediminimonas sp.]|uniref:tetratricopeptide repeat protein n=1 Tax=Lacisediminimonas sp. TaxID=3060582 RepID=UPI0027196A4D|nr:tetratricopeptide repeat protein [Lacisediminimonas sp.]MDO8298165.1 tetratricopeptide repeat protein [Lacisediminimonas sp.]
MKRLIAAFVVVGVLAGASAEEPNQSANAASKREGILDNAAIHIRARSAFEDGAGTAPHALTLFSTARALAAQNKINDAIEIYRSLNQTYPGLPEPYNNLGLLHLLLEQYENAELAFLAALRIDPGYSIAQENLGDVHARMALRAYDAAARLEPDGSAAREKIRYLMPVVRSKSPTPSVGLSRVGGPPTEMIGSDRRN